MYHIHILSLSLCVSLSLCMSVSTGDISRKDRRLEELEALVQEQQAKLKQNKLDLDAKFNQNKTLMTTNRELEDTIQQLKQDKLTDASRISELEADLQGAHLDASSAADKSSQGPPLPVCVYVYRSLSLSLSL